MSPLHKLADSGHVATYGGAGATIVFKGLHVNEVCAIISTAVAVIGLILQVYMAWRKSQQNRA